MILKYQPEGAEEKVWTYAPDKLMSAEAEALERVTGKTYQEFGLELVKGSITCRRALLWVLMKRAEPSLLHKQVDVPTGALTLDYEAHELIAMRDAAEKNPSLNEEDRAAVLEQLDAWIGEASEPPKASEKSEG